MYLHSLSLACFLSFSVLFPNICSFHISDCSLFVKALLDLLCKKITPMNCWYYFRIDLLDLARGFVDSCVKTALHVHILYWKEGIDPPGFEQSTPPKQHAMHGITPAVGDGWSTSFGEMCWQNGVIQSVSLGGVSHPNCLHTLWRVGAPGVSPTCARWGTPLTQLSMNHGNRIPREAYQCSTDKPKDT